MIKARLKKLRFVTLGFLILLLALSPVSSVFAQGLGHGFYGTVTIGGVNAGAGTVISAQVGGIQYGSCTVTTPGQYALIVQGSISDGATIDFYVAGQKADQTFAFHDGWTTNLGLTAPAPPPPPQPPPPAQPVYPTVSIQAATIIAINSTTLSMNYTKGDFSSVEVRFVYKKSGDPTWSYNTSWVSKSVDGNHTESLTGLSPNTTYNFTAQIKYDDTVIEGDILQFTTLAVVTPITPTVTTQAATNITTDSATPNMKYTVGDFSPVQVCFAYKKSAGSAWSYTAWVSKAADGTYAEPLPGLVSGTKYDFKAQLKYNGTVIEGNTLQFTTVTKRGCFIATAAYGTPTAEQIDVLREFRDAVLLESAPGSQFVALYYRLSPPIADFIAGNELLRTLVRELLVDPIVWVVEATGDIWRN
jgi:hypothetical protein